MRETKFRAKRIKDNEWVVGEPHMKCCPPHIHTGEAKTCLIDKETLGQFTGLRDKNEKEIYEDDIMQITTTSDKYLFKVTWNEELGAWCFMMKGDIKEGVKPLGEWLGEYWDKIEVIGNIHDNPELLEY